MAGRIGDQTMANLDGWDWALSAVAGYVAVLSLVRLMSYHRDSVLDQICEQIYQKMKGQRKEQLEVRPTEVSQKSDEQKTHEAA